MLTVLGRDLLSPLDEIPSSRTGAWSSAPLTGYGVSPSRGGNTGSLTASVVFHLALGVAVLTIGQTPPQPPPTPITRVAPRLVTLVYIPEVRLELPPLPTPAPLPKAKLEVRSEEPLPEAPVELPVRAFENRRAEVAPAPESRSIEAPPRPAAPRKPAATVMVGAFPNNAAVPTPTPSREVENVAFDAPQLRASEATSATTAVGGFDRPVAPDDRGIPRPVDNVVAAGFSRDKASAPPAPEARVVRETGFGASNSRERPRQAEPVTVAPAGFANAADVKPVGKTAPPPAPTRVIPVEVLAKPSPTYTEEARRLKIEGEVLLEVDFTSAGKVRVLKVIRGLGHGLDEAAVRAAEQMQFKPAHEDGRAVDFRTTVHIVFRLA